MSKLFFLIILLITTNSAIYAQQLPIPLPTLASGWHRIFIKNVGSFDLPPSLEIQAGKYQEFVVAMKMAMGINASKIVAQPKGLNSVGKNSFSKYARLLFDIENGLPGDYLRLNFDVNSISQAEINELNAHYKKGTIEGFSGTGLKLIEWYPLKIEKINGMSCLHIIYKRQLNDNPMVLVNTYYFQNNDSMCTLTLSYRISESDYWSTDYAAILKSFRISDIK